MGIVNVDGHLIREDAPRQAQALEVADNALNPG